MVVVPDGSGRRPAAQAAVTFGFSIEPGALATQHSTTNLGMPRFHHAGNDVSPRVYGYLAMVNADGFCGRIRLRYWDGNTLVDHEPWQAQASVNLFP